MTADEHHPRWSRAVAERTGILDEFSQFMAQSGTALTRMLSETRE